MPKPLRVATLLDVSVACNGDSEPSINAFLDELLVICWLIQRAVNKRLDAGAFMTRVYKNAQSPTMILGIVKRGDTGSPPQAFVNVGIEIKKLVVASISRLYRRSRALNLGIDQPI